MNNFSHKLRLMFSDGQLRKRIFFVIGALVVFRIAAAIPIPGVDPLALQQFFANNQFLGLLNVFSGSGLSNLSIVMLGVGPYITGSIIMQLLTMMSPKLKALYHEEGEAGRKKFTQYSRLLTVPLAMLQGYGLLVLLSRQGVLASMTPFDMFTNILIVTAGSVFLMWIGELISEFGVGNGVSLIIFGGIVADPRRLRSVTDHALPHVPRRVGRYRHRRDRHDRGGAPGADHVCKARPRRKDVRRGFHLPAASRQSSGRHSDHLCPLDPVISPAHCRVSYGAQQCDRTADR